MSTACGRPQGMERVRPMWTHVDRGEGIKNLIFLWTSYMDGPLCPPISPRSCSISPYSSSSHYFQIHSFIHIEHLYSASSRKLLRSAPNTSTVKQSSLKVRKKRRRSG